MYIWLTVSSYMVKYLRISSYIRKPFLIYYFATVFLIYEETLIFLFISVPACFPLSEWFEWLKLYFSCCLSLIVVGAVAGSTGYRLTRAETCSSSRRGEGKRRDPLCMAAGCFPRKQNSCNGTFRLIEVLCWYVWERLRFILSVEN
jgi:hypothetical protein